MPNEKTPKIKPLTSGSSHISALFSKLRKVVTLIVFIFGFEYFFGHPALRWTWEGTSSEPSSAYRCTMLSFPFLHYHEIDGYKTLVSTVEPHQTIFQWISDKGRNLIQE
jgi:hypothetical protein